MSKHQVHASIEAAAARAEPKLAKLAPKITAAAPGTSSAVLTLFKNLFLPMLAPLIASLLTKYGGGKLRPYLEPVRDILVLAYPVEEDEPGPFA